MLFQYTNVLESHHIVSVNYRVVTRFSQWEGEIDTSNSREHRWF